MAGPTPGHFAFGEAAPKSPHPACRLPSPIPAGRAKAPSRPAPSRHTRSLPPPSPSPVAARNGRRCPTGRMRASYPTTTAARVRTTTPPSPCLVSTGASLPTPQRKKPGSSPGEANVTEQRSLPLSAVIPAKAGIPLWRRPTRHSIMIPALRNLQHAISGAIDQPMLLRDAARPPAGEIASQGLRLPDPLKRIQARVLDQCVEALQRRSVVVV